MHEYRSLNDTDYDQGNETRAIRILNSAVVSASVKNASQDVKTFAHEEEVQLTIRHAMVRAVNRAASSMVAYRRSPNTDSNPNRRPCRNWVAMSYGAPMANLEAVARKHLIRAQPKVKTGLAETVITNQGHGKY